MVECLIKEWVKGIDFKKNHDFRLCFLLYSI